MPKFSDEIDVVQNNTLSKQKGSPLTKPTSATENRLILQTLTARPNNPANTATRFLEGAVIEITNPHLSVDNTLYPDSEFKKPTTYKRKIQKVVDGKNIIMPPYKITRKSDGQTRAVPLNKFNFSLQYEKTIVKPNTSGVFKKSYADIQFSNLQTFSGDVYKAKVFTKEKGTQGDFEKIGEVVLDGQNQLVNNNGVTGFETIGIFHTQSIIEDGWVTSSNLASATQGEDEIAASVLLSGSNGAHASEFTFLTSGSYGLQRGEDYMVSFDTYFTKANKTDVDGNVSETAELEVYLTGSVNSPTASEVSLGTLDNTFEGMKGRSEGRIDGVFNYFKTHNKRAVEPDVKLGFRVKSGNFKLANVSLTPYFEKNFNPVSFRTLLPMPKPVKRGQRFDFYTEFYDFNNNRASFQAETSESVVFDGAPQVLADGTDGLLTGSIFLGSVTGSGIELHGGSAYMRSIGYDGFADTISNNVGGFMIFSGSVQSQIGASETYEGVGLEIVDAHGSTDRFLKFRTNPSEFTVQTDQFFFGKEGQFISGSNGNIVISSSNFFLGGESTFVSGSNDKLEISSSNFHLDNDGSVTMAGTITAEAGGTIGGFTINSDNLTATNFVLNTTNKALTLGSGNSVFIADADDGIQLGHATFASAPFSVTPAGVLKAEAGEIGGFGLGGTTISSSNNNLILKDSGQITGSNVKFDGGTIGGFVITDSKIETSDFVSGLKGVRISTEQNGLIEAENARIRGTLATTTFEKESVNAVGGQLHVANATMITGSSMGINDKSASVANVSGFTVGEVVIAKKVSGTGFNTEYMRVHSSSRLSSDDNDQSGLLFVTRSFSGSTHAATGSEGFRGEAFGQSSSYDPGQVLVSTGVSGSGYIRLNANPRDLATPYIDIIERTGSGVYDTQLKARLGDLSGLSRDVIGTSTPGFGLFSENVFLTGTISASAGSIGGISLDSDKLFSGTGTHGNSNTAFFLQGGSGATAGDFSLGDKLVWDASEGTLNIDGTLTIGSLPDGTVSSSAQLASDISGAADVSAVSASAAAGQSGSIAFDTHATQVVLSSTGMDVKNSSAQTIASFGASAKLFGGANNTADFAEVNADGLTIVANSKTASIMDSGGTAIMGGTATASINSDGVTLISAGVTGSKFTATTSSMFGASSNDRVEVTDTGLKVYESNKQMVNVGSSGLDVYDTSNNRVAQFASTTVIGSSTDKVTISDSGVTIRENNVDTIQLESGALIVGEVGASKSNVQITSGALNFRNNTTNKLTLAANGNFSIGSNFSVTSGGDVTMEGSVTADSGEIGGWVINSAHLQGGPVKLDRAGLIQVTGSTFQGTDEKEVIAKISGSRGNLAEGAVFLIEREGIINSAANVPILRLNTSQSYDDPTDYTNNVDKKAMTMTFADGSNTGGNAKATASRTVSSDNGAGAAAWGGPIFFKADASNDLDDFELATSMAANEMMDSGEPNNVVELTFDELQVRFKDLDGGTNKAQFQYKIQVFQGDTNASASAELVSEFRFSDVLTQGVNSGLNIPPVTLNKQFFFLQLTGTGYDEINSTHEDGNTFEVHGGDGQQGTATPIQGTQFLPKVRLNGLGFQTYAGANQHVTFGADNKVVGDMYVRKTSTATRGNMFVQGSVAIGGLAIDADNELFVDGNIAATGNITAFFTSDERLKNNVVRIENGLSIINQLRPIEFEWDEKSPFYHDKFRDYGLLAQEVEKVLPNIVGEMKDGYKGIKYEKIIPFLIDSIQQLTKRVEELEGK